MMSTAMVVVFVSACFMQEVNAAFLGRADSKDDASCAQCLPAANKFLGSDCKELRCLVQAAAATKLSSADDRKKASTAYGVFRGCAKENKCNLDIAKAAAEELQLNFEYIASLFQVDDESSEDDDESSEDEEADAQKAQRDEDAPETTAENRESEQKEAARQIRVPPTFLQVDEESTLDEDADEDADAADEESQESELKEAERQLAEDSDDREEESAFEGSEQEEAEDHDDSLVVSESDSRGEAMREAAEESAYTSSTLSQDDGSCAKCLAPANKLVGADCKDFVCVVRAFDARKKIIMASEVGRKEAAALEESVSRCAKENKCDLQPAITAAYELGMDLSELNSLIQFDDSSLNLPQA